MELSHNTRGAKESGEIVPTWRSYRDWILRESIREDYLYIKHQGRRMKEKQAIKTLSGIFDTR
jgi:hypothetical protein